MTKLQLYSEPFAKTGNMAAEGFRRLLGRPTLGLLQTLVREGIQNILDAAREQTGATALIRLRTLDVDQRRALCEQVLAHRPHGDATRDEIDAALEKKSLRVLELCDFGTAGLSGPTRADAPHDHSEPLNFVNFLRNVGAARDTHHGGGTYGYGKSSLYAMSGCSTIVVDSQTWCAGSEERRLMGCHLGAAFDAVGENGVRRRFTGRHWWGSLDGEDSVEPMTDAEAIRLSQALGMPDRDSQRSGTSILIVDPLFGDDEPHTVIEDIIEAVLWNFWPRMTATTPKNRKLKVLVELEGNPITIPPPEEFPPLDLFAAAIATHRSGDGELQPIYCQRPSKRLGSLVMQKGLCAQRRGPASRTDSLIPKQSSHIALMRPVELVVKYLVGEPYSDQRFEWAGVFVCSDDDAVEDAFAMAEPPAHDDWIPDNLPKGHAKTFVRVALRNLSEAASIQAGPGIVPANSDDGQGLSLAATASRMGAFLDRVSARGPGRSKNGGRSSSGRKSLAISPAKFAGLQLDDEGQPVARFLAEVRNDASDSSLHVIAEPFLVVDGGSTATDDLPGEFSLEIAEMRLGDRLSTAGQPWLHIGHEGGTIEVTVPTLPIGAIGLKLRLVLGEPA